MSDAVSNAEIEDVLASIRRLVSEHQISDRESDMDGGEDLTKKLVLTPALRVVEPDESFTPAEAETEAAADQADESPAETPETAEADDASGEADTVDAAADDQPADDAGSESAGDDLEHQIAELEAAVSRTFSEYEPAIAEEVEDEGATAVLNTRRAQMFGAAGFEEAEVVEETPAEEPAAERQHSESRPDPILPTNDDQDLYLDEDALRELVATFVREELRGRMGEKITQSVRRMVRREIHRALSVRELD